MNKFWIIFDFFFGAIDVGLAITYFVNGNGWGWVFVAYAIIMFVMGSLTVHLEIERKKYVSR